MQNNNKSLIQHVSGFLEYGKNERDFSDKTIENYGRYLNRFIFWLKTSKLTHLTPQELSTKHIVEYQNHLTKQNITKITQNYYLIALRMLIAYFIEKEIPCSVQMEKIKLLKIEKKESIQALTQEQLEKLLSMPNTSHNIGLRDKALLSLLTTTGLKISELIVINKNDIIFDEKNGKGIINILNKNKIEKTIYLLEQTINTIENYLKSRNDNNRALFINYGPNLKQNVDKRLTVRSIERIVERYKTMAGIFSVVTPESLRNAYIASILNKDIDELTGVSNHLSLTIKQYAPNLNYREQVKTINKNPSWTVTEKAINEEIVWLKNNIDTMPPKYYTKETLLTCEDCLLRKIAILIVSGKIKVNELKLEENFWNQNKSNVSSNHRHGKDWHANMMNTVSNYFGSNGHKIILEPLLNFGRADLGVITKTSDSPIYIEVGTTSLYKLLYNLLTIKNSTFLIIPFENKIIELKT